MERNGRGPHDGRIPAFQQCRAQTGESQQTGSSLSTFRYRPVCSPDTKQCRQTGTKALRHRHNLGQQEPEFKSTAGHRRTFLRSITATHRMKESGSGPKKQRGVHLWKHNSVSEAPHLATRITRAPDCLALSTAK